MKFTNGFWLYREGYTPHFPMETRNICVGHDSLEIHATRKRIEHRGDTLVGPVFTISYTSPAPNVIKVSMAHFKGTPKKGPFFPICESSAKGFVRVEEHDGYVELKSGGLAARISKPDFRVEYYQNDKPLTSCGPRYTAYIKSPEGEAFFREQFSLDVGETVYGLGERFGPLVKNGQTVEIWNEDGGTCSEQAYKNVPFYMTSKGYGVLTDHAGLVSYEVASEQVSRVQFSVRGEYLDYYVIGGGTPKAVLSNYTALTGKPALPPPWSFGLWLTTSFTTSYDEETATHFIDGMKERDIPLSVFHFDCFWMHEMRWCDFTWDNEVFPDPEGLLRRLKNRGLKICVWINPYIAQWSPLFDEGMVNGFLLKTVDGGVWQWDKWQPGMAIVDFTNPEATAWYQSKLKALIDMGVDCFKTDFGERIPTDVVYFDGSDPEKMHNFYSYLYNKAVFDMLEELLGKGNAVVFARSATAGSQRFSAHWGGDCSASYPSMAETLRGGLSLSMSGFSFWSHDISGFESTASPDLYKRWAAFGLLSTHSRLHGASSYRVPWLFDEEAVDVLRHFVKLKNSLMPTLFASAVESTQTGIPMMRAMALEFPESPACAYLDRQYMLGDSLLVAPIFASDGTVTYYLPEGRFTNFIGGNVLSGNTYVTETHDYFSLPLMVPENTILAVGARTDDAEYDYISGVCLQLFELSGEAQAKVYSPDRHKTLIAEARLTGRTVHVRVMYSYVPDAAIFSILLRNIESVCAVEGGSFEQTTQGVLIKPAFIQNANEYALIIEL